MNIASQYIGDFISLFYPKLCASCGNALNSGEDVICTFCLYYLPKTNFHLEKNNAIEKHFWGRVDIHRAASCYFFQRGNSVQHLIHQLKYKGKKEVGIKIGMIYGSELVNCEDFKNIDLIAPVPLHYSKELQRAYNQVDLFCEGLSISMNKPWKKDTLERVKASETQTHKSRFERWKNVETLFMVNHPSSVEGNIFYYVMMLSQPALLWKQVREQY